MESNHDNISFNKKSPQEHPLVSTFGGVLKANWIEILIALVSTVVLILLFAFLAVQVFDKDLVNFDKNLALWSYSLADPFLNFFFTIFTDMGSPVGVAVMTVLTFGLLIWRKMYGYACLAIILVVGSALIDEILKVIFRRVRPDLLVGGQHLSSYSFPSGHATGSICFFGFLIWLSWRLLNRTVLKVIITVFMVLMILLVGFSRIYLGVHYPTDVLGGYLAGGSWLILLLGSYNIFYHYRMMLHPPLKNKSPD